MDANRFDALTRALTAAGSRRAALALALGGTLAPLLGLGETEAEKSLKKCKKIDNKKRRKKCIKKAKSANTCQDGVKNGSESDVDCGGGTCPRCAVGKTCTGRADCASARCDGGTCKSCDNAVTDCGLGADGQQCFCRPTPGGEKFCTRQLCRFFAGDSCANCVAGEECLVAGGGADRECCIPCGA